MLNCHYILARKDRDVLLCIYIYIYLPVVVTDWNMFLQGFCKSSYRVRHKVCSATHTHQEGCSNHRTMLHEHKFTPKSSAIQLRNHEMPWLNLTLKSKELTADFRCPPSDTHSTLVTGFSVSSYSSTETLAISSSITSTCIPYTCRIIRRWVNLQRKKMYS